MNTMNIRPPPHGNSINPFEAAALLRRLLINLRGFAYRRRYDRLWTMEWVSDGFLSVTGFDSHRIIKNQSLSFANLILADDLPGAAATIDRALKGRHRTTVPYRIKAAHQAAVTVEDRLVGVYDASGAVVAIEGIIDRAENCMHSSPSPQDERLFASNHEFTQPFALQS
jgi:hypothetical protein